MVELKTKQTDEDVHQFLAKISDEQKRKDCITLTQLIKDISGEEPKMWGTMIGFGTYSYKYASGHGGEWFAVGFAPRAKNITVYIMGGFDGYQQLLDKLGPHSTGKSCLYIKHLSDINTEVLREIISKSIKAVSRHQ